MLKNTFNSVYKKPMSVQKNKTTPWRHRAVNKICQRCSLVIIFLIFILGIIFWGAFNTALEQTNNMEFCITCHEMKENVYQEYRTTIHYSNRTGVRATCPDCHVPREWAPMLVRKVQATNELLHKLLGSIDTKEKFESKRIQLASHVWESMKKTDSRECRNCHDFTAMNLARQQSRSRTIHRLSQQKNKTCIDCHKGIAHQLPVDYEAYRGGSNEDHDFYSKENIPCQQCHPDMPAQNNENWD